MNHEHNPFHSFIETYQNHHSPKNTNTTPRKDILKLEKVFLSIFEIGLFETYNFLYQHCQNKDDFKNWIIKLKGEIFFNSAVLKFNQWEISKPADFANEDFLTEAQHIFFKEYGYLKIDELISTADCDAVCNLICNTLDIDLQDSNSWYPIHEMLQGLMLQLYQDTAIEKIRNNDKIKKVFASLYRNENILPNCEKLSYNPPVNAHFTFKGSPLHWDIDFNLGPQFYIQGLVYLNDVPVERGAFTVIPRFHHQTKEFIKQYKTPDEAMNALRNKGLEVAIPGKKGDLVVWLQALPHAASPNHSNLPRFVQYVSFI